MSNHIFHTERAKDKTESVQVQEEKKLLRVASLRPHKGQRIWEYNYETGEIGIAEMEAQPATFGGKVKVQFGGFTESIPQAVHHKLIVKENCEYTCAINIENAVKKFGLNVKIVKSKKQKQAEHNG